MVWTKISRVWTTCWWCEQNYDGVNLQNGWCEQNVDGVNKIFKSVINIFMVWTKSWRCDLVNWWCEQFFFGVIKCWWCDETIFRCEQTSIFWKLCDHTVWCDVFTCFFLMASVSRPCCWSSWRPRRYGPCPCPRGPCPGAYARLPVQARAPGRSRRPELSPFPAIWLFAMLLNCRHLLNADLLWNSLNNGWPQNQQFLERVPHLGQFWIVGTPHLVYLNSVMPQ